MPTAIIDALAYIILPLDKVYLDILALILNNTTLESVLSDNGRYKRTLCITYMMVTSTDSTI